MDPLSEQFVEKTWQQVAAFTPARAKKDMLAMGKWKVFCVNIKMSKSLL